MMKILALVFHLAAAPNAVKVASHKADMRASERIIVKESNGEQSRKRQVRDMWRADVKTYAGHSYTNEHGHRVTVEPTVVTTIGR